MVLTLGFSPEFDVEGIEGEGVDPVIAIVVTRCVLSVLDLGRFGGTLFVDDVLGGLGDLDEEEVAAGFAATLASCTQLAIDCRAVVKSTARFACARSPFDPTTCMMRSGDMLRRNSISPESRQREEVSGRKTNLRARFSRR